MINFINYFDTLEHIRNTEVADTLYSHDYNDMKKLREITDKNNIALLLIHHTRKRHDPDPKYKFFIKTN